MLVRLNYIDNVNRLLACRYVKQILTSLQDCTKIYITLIGICTTPTFTVSSDFFLPFGLKWANLSFRLAFWAAWNCTSSAVAPELDAADEKLLFPWVRLAINSSNDSGFSATVAVATSLPHSPQNLASARSTVPQFWQNILYDSKAENRPEKQQNIKQQKRFTLTNTSHSWDVQLWFHRTYNFTILIGTKWTKKGKNLSLRNKE